MSSLSSRAPVSRLAVALVVAALVLTVASLGARSAPAGAAPLNDSFANAVAISSGTGSAIGDSTGSTAEPGEPKHAVNDAATDSSVWFNWTSPINGNVIFRTKGSNYDTILAAYLGTNLPTLSQQASNDDTPFNDGSNRQSQIRFRAVAGSVYRIAVEGFTSTGDFIPKQGRIQLSWTIEDDFGVEPNLFGPATPFSSTTVVTFGATKDPFEPAHAGNVGGHSVWFNWTAPATGPATFVTSGSSFDTLLAVYTGNSVSTLTPVKSNNDRSSTNKDSLVTFQATKSTKYRIAVDGVNGAEGVSVLSYAQKAGPSIAIGDATKVEGNSGTKVLVLPVQLSAAQSSPVTVTFATANATAVAPGDYVAKTGTVTFAAGTTTKNIGIVINGDTAKEATETFRVNLSNAAGANASIGDAQAVGTIQNDD
jgi:hypothetical protein